MIRFKIPASLYNYRSLADKTVRVTFETNELTAEQISGIHSSLQSFGVLVFVTEDEETDDDVQ